MDPGGAGLQCDGLGIGRLADVHSVDGRFLLERKAAVKKRDAIDDHRWPRFPIIGSLLLSMITAETPLFALPFISAFLGIAFGLVITTTTVSVQSAVGWSLRGVATATNAFSRNLGQTMGAALLGTFFNARITSYLLERDALANIHIEQLNDLISRQSVQQIPETLRNVLRDVLVYGIHNVFIAFIVLVFIALLIGSLLPGHKAKQKSSAS